jgi:hypothetical protein
VLHAHRVCTVAATPRLKKKVPAGTLCLIGQKARILTDFVQISSDFGDFEEVVAELPALMQQYRNQFVIARLELGISVYIDDVYGYPELG